MVREAEELRLTLIAKAIEVRNQGDSLVHQTEKLLEELGDKVDDEQKADIDAGIAALKTTLESDDTAAIEKAIEELDGKEAALAEALSSWCSRLRVAPGAPGVMMDPPAGGTDGDDDVIDADFEVQPRTRCLRFHADR